MDLVETLRNAFVPVRKEGYPFIAGFAAVTLLLGFFSISLFWIGLILTAWCAYFFRDPVRVTPLDDRLVVSPADGVISATPTGSTAYSFSAGGPIVSPSVPSIVVTPIAAHMVFDRSLVLGPEQRVRLEVVGEEPGLLSADGRAALELPVGAHVEIGRASTPARLVRREDAPPFFELVRDKFGLPGQVGGPG